MLIWFLGYALVAAGIILWDAYIGFGFEFPSIEDGPNAAIAGLLWPIGLPIILAISFGLAISSVKERRMQKKEERKQLLAEQKRFRIAAEKERDKILEQIEEEIGHVEAESQNATEHARILPGSSSSYLKS
jgi:hypothetical protein